MKLRKQGGTVLVQEVKCLESLSGHYYLRLSRLRRRALSAVLVLLCSRSCLPKILEGYCRELRQVLRQQEDLEAQARDMYELEQAKDQLMTLFKVGLANVGMWVRDQYVGESYQHCGWQRLLPFFKLGGWVTTTASEVQLEFCAFNNRALVRDARGGVSQSERWRSSLARWETVGGGSREAASYLSLHGAAGQYRLSLTLDMQCCKRQTPW
jgi:hypothetical protein